MVFKTQPSELRRLAVNPRIVLGLLVLSVAINYIDRGSLSIAAPAMSAELSLSPVEMGVLLSSFFWTYSVCQILSGWLVDRYDVGRILAIGFAIWSAATCGVGLVSTMQGVLLFRLILGAGESVAFPAYSKIITTGFPPHRRGVPNALIDAGLKLGPGLGILLGGLLVARLGWRILFLTLGLGGLLWLVPWLIWMPRKPVESDNSKLAAGPTVINILRKRDAWGCFIGNFCNNYAYYFLLTWLPSYLVLERKLTMQQMALVSALPYTASAVSSLFGGWLSDRLISNGASATIVRKAFMVGGLLGSMIVLPAANAGTMPLFLGLLTVAYVATGLFSSNHWALSQTIAGPLAAGKWTGLQNAFANLAGVIAPAATGLLFAKTGSFYSSFAVAAFVLLIGAASYLFVVGKVEETTWPSGLDGIPPIRNSGDKTTG